MYIKDKWLSEQFGFSVFNIKNLNTKIINKIDDTNQKSLIIYKTKNNKNNNVFLKKNKFKLIEKTIIFSLSINKTYFFDNN